MSVVTYNGIRIIYPFTTTFDQNVKYDELGDTDWYCTEFDITVQGILNINYIDTIAPQFAGITTPANAAAIMDAIRTELLQPRRTLSVKVNGIELIPLAQSGLPGQVDAQNGPKPQRCSITELTKETFFIVFHIIAHYWESNTTPTSSLSVTNQQGGVVLYNRWTEMISIDNCMMSTITREGKYVIRSDNFQGKIADAVRGSMAVVSLAEGFLRDYASYTQTPDGLGLQYRIVDKEVFKMPPKPAYEATGWYSESLTTGNAIRYGEVYIRLKGCKDKNISSQANLVLVAFATAGIKLVFNGAVLTKSKGFSLLQSANLKVHMWDNIVEFHIKVMLTAKKLRVGGMAGFVDSGKDIIAPLTFTPFCEDSSGNEGPDYLDRGTAGILLQAAAYYDPSLISMKLGPGTSFQAPANASTADASQLLGIKIGQAGVISEVI